MTVERRLVSLERTFGPTSPPGCRWRGDRCATYEIVRVGPDDPPRPIPLATCPACGRPTFIRSYILIRDDAEPPAIPALAEGA